MDITNEFCSLAFFLGHSFDRVDTLIQQDVSFLLLAENSPFKVCQLSSGKERPAFCMLSTAMAEVRERA